MKQALRLFGLAFLLAALSGCGNPLPITASNDPAAPSVVPTVAPTPASTPTIRGSITVTSLTPPPGATLSVRECPFYYGETGSCSDAKVAVEVALEQSVADAVVTVSYYRNAERCGIAYAGPTALPTSTLTAFTATLIELSDESVSLHCAPLPATTNRFVVQVWSAKQPSTSLLTQEFAHGYTFANP
jgi:hypothetical protein